MNMELNEALLIVAAIVVLLVVPILLDRYLNPKAKIIVNLIAVLMLTGMFTYTLIENFNYTRLATTSLLIFVCVYSFYRKYKKYKKGLSID